MLGSIIPLALELVASPQASIFSLQNQSTILAHLCCEQLAQRFLEFYFQDRPGLRFVVRGDYELRTAGDESILVPTESATNQWRHVVKPGAELDMNAILRRSLGDRSCPSCKRPVNENTLQQVVGFQWCVLAIIVSVLR